jgi:hypothetical protein
MGGLGNPATSRRGFIRASAAAIGAASVTGLAAGCGGSIANAAGTASSALDLTSAVLEAFKTHRLVGLGESHGLQNHHDVLAMLLNDPRVPAVVDDIVVEFGNAIYQTTIDRFVAGQPVGNADLRRVWRNTTQSPVETWDEPVYEQFYRTVRAANWTLREGKQMRVQLGDPPINWSRITTIREWVRFLNQRDTHAASVVEKHVLANGRRALLCYGAEHLLRVPGNLAAIIEKRTGERTYTIIDLVPSSGDPGGLARRLSSYPRNSVLPTAGTWLGSFDAGFIPPALVSNRTGTVTNPWCGVKLGSLADAGIYLGQPDALTASWWNPAIFLDPAYWAELQRRSALQGTPPGGPKTPGLESYRQEQPARFALLPIPTSAQCRA